MLIDIPEINITCQYTEGHPLNLQLSGYNDYNDSSSRISLQAVESFTRLLILVAANHAS